MTAASPQFEQFRLSTNREQMIHSKFHQCNFSAEEIFWVGRGSVNTAVELDFQGIPNSRLFVPANSILFMRGICVFMDENQFNAGTADVLVGEWQYAVSRLGLGVAPVAAPNVDLDGAGTQNNPVVTWYGAAGLVSATTTAFDIANTGATANSYIRLRHTFATANRAWKVYYQCNALAYRTLTDQWQNKAVYGGIAGGRV